MGKFCFSHWAYSMCHHQSFCMWTAPWWGNYVKKSCGWFEKLRPSCGVTKASVCVVNAADSGLANNTFTETGYSWQGFLLCTNARTQKKTCMGDLRQQGGNKHMHTPRHTCSVFLVIPSLSSIRLLRQTLSSCWPGHVTSAMLDQHETSLDGAHRWGASPCLSKDRPWHKWEINTVTVT